MRIVRRVVGLDWSVNADSIGFSASEGLATEGARDRSHVYSVDPETLRCLSRYFDSLMVAASLTSGGSGGSSR